MSCPFCQAVNPPDADSCLTCGKDLYRLAPGYVLSSRYEILKPLGRGGMGVVYKAHDRDLEEVVAIKVLRTDVAGSAEMARRFRLEIKLARKVRHRNVCAIHEYGQAGPIRFIAMEYIEGVDFRQILRERRLSPDEAFEVALQVADGLQAIHDTGVVHRDLKTPNVMRDARGVVRLMDFGIAKQFETQEISAVTGTGMIVGTPEYMSPEQVRGLKLDARSDIYALGVLTYELFTGRVPFHGTTPVATLLKHLQEPPPLDAQSSPDLLPTLVPVLERALAKAPEGRFGSAREMAEALQRARRATPAGPITRTEPPTQRDGRSALDRAALEPPQTQTTAVPAQKPTLVPPPTIPHSTAATSTLGGLAPPGGAPQPPVTAETPLRPTRRLGSGRLPARTGLLISGLLLLSGGAAYFLHGRPAAPSATQPAADRGPAASVNPASPEPTSLESSPAPTSRPQLAAPAPAGGSTAVPPGGAAASKIGHAAALDAARAAIAKTDYAKARASAEAVLRDEPANADARAVLRQVEGGEKAEAAFRAAEEALARNDLVVALRETAAGRAAAPWDLRGPALAARIKDAEQQRQQQVAAQLGALISQAESAFASEKYDAAISLYDEALKLDPASQRAGVGRANALGAKAMAHTSPAGKAPAGKAFGQGETVAQSAETRDAGSAPQGFAPTSAVEVKPLSQAAALPGKVVFEVEPSAPAPGDEYKVKIYLVNEGSAPIEIKEVIVTSIVNGKKVAGAVPTRVRSVAPRQRALVSELPDFWRIDIKSWSIEAVVRTDRGESYRNQITWK